MRRTSLLVALTLLGSGEAALIQGCKPSSRQSNRTESIMGKSLAETIEDHRTHLLSIPGVLRVEPGTCGSDSCVKVYVEKKTPIIEAQIPLMLETWQVDVIESSP